MRRNTACSTVQERMDAHRGGAMLGHHFATRDQSSGAAVVRSPLKRTAMVVCSRLTLAVRQPAMERLTSWQLQLLHQHSQSSLNTFFKKASTAILAASDAA